MILWRVVVATALVLVGFAFGWHARPPTQPKVQIEYKDRVEYKDRIVTKEVEGPTRTVVRKVSVPGPAGPTVTVEKIVEKAGETREVVREVAGAAWTERVEVQTPAPPLPRWSLGGGVVLGREGLGPVVQGGVRILGPFWLDVQVEPTRPSVGAILRVNF